MDVLESEIAENGLQKKGGEGFVLDHHYVHIVA
jgi:hypothetical protein